MSILELEDELAFIHQVVLTIADYESSINHEITHQSAAMGDHVTNECFWVVFIIGHEASIP